MKLLLILNILCVSTVLAGFKLPNYVFKAEQAVAAMAEASAEKKPLVLLMTEETSD